MNFVFEDGALLAKNKHVRIVRKKLTLSECSVIRILLYQNYIFIDLTIKYKWVFKAYNLKIRGH